MTASQLMDKGLWDRFCEIRGWNPWCCNEGQLDSHEDLNITITEYQALLGVEEYSQRP